MRLIFAFVLLLGLGLAGAATYMARNLMTAQQTARQAAAASDAVAMQDVFVTASKVRYGEDLDPSVLRIVAFPKAAVPPGAFLSVDALFPQGREVHRAVLRTMEAGEVVLAAKVTEPGEEAGISSRLSPGMRAFAIGVDVSSGVSGFLRPGDRVDIYWTGRRSARDDARDMTKLIQAGIRLVGVDQSADENLSETTVARTVTVEVTPRQVAALAQAQSSGSLSLSLVGANEEGTADMVEIDQSELLGLEVAQAVQAGPDRVCTIRTRRGSEVVETPIPCAD